MKIVVNIKKSYFFAILGLILLFGIIGIGYAYNSGKAPSELGHSAEEIEVTIPGVGVRTLNDAIANGLIGGNSGGFEIIGPLTDSTPGATIHDISFNLDSASEVLIFSYVNVAVGNAQRGKLSFYLNDELVDDSIIGEDAVSGGAGFSEMTLNARTNLNAGSHTLKSQISGSGSIVAPGDYSGNAYPGAKFYVYILG